MPICAPALLSRSCCVGGLCEAILAKIAILNIQPNISDLRNAPANPSRMSARSRRPINLASVPATISRISDVRTGAFWTDAVPNLRLVPFRVFRTMPADVGDSAPVAFMRLRNGVQPPLDAADLQSPGAFSDVGCDCLRRRRQGANAMPRPEQQ